MINAQTAALKASIAARAMQIHYQEFQYYIQFQQSAGRACALIGGLAFSGMLFIMFFSQQIHNDKFFPAIFFCGVSAGAGLLGVSKGTICSMLAPGHALRGDTTNGSPLCTTPLRKESRDIFYLMQTMLVSMLIAVGTMLPAAVNETWKQVLIIVVVAGFVVVAVGIIVRLTKTFHVDAPRDQGHQRIGGHDLEKIGLMPQGGPSSSAAVPETSLGD